MDVLDVEKTFIHCQVLKNIEVYVYRTIVFICYRFILYYSLKTPVHFNFSLLFKCMSNKRVFFYSLSFSLRFKSSEKKLQLI
jgi:hypothetical protein